MESIEKFYNLLPSLPTPSFTLTGSRFDLNTLKGRFLHFLTIVDPTTLFVNENEIIQAKNELLLYKEGKSNKNDKELWRLRSIVESSLHPTTNEIIPWPFR